MRWSNDDTDCLKVLREEGWEVKEIASEMGFSIGTIENWIRKCNMVKFKKWSDVEDTHLRTLVVAGKTNEECSRVLGRSVDGIRNRKVKLDIVPEGEKDSNLVYSQKPDRLTKVYLIEFDGFYKVGTTQQTITQRFGGRYPQYEVLLIIETTLEEALRIEREWLENVKHLKYVPDCFPTEGRGFTECFKI